MENIFQYLHYTKKEEKESWAGAVLKIAQNSDLTAPPTTPLLAYSIPQISSGILARSHSNNNSISSI
jgi:hypothetical protein